MDSHTATIDKICPRGDIAAYLDGELALREELFLETHVVGCGECLAELNLQKEMLAALDFGLADKDEIKLPANFAKVVAVRAESGVRGLRSKEERFRALFLCATLFLIIVIGLGAETGGVMATLAKFGERGMAVTVFVWHLIYDLAIGTAIILRSLSGQFVFNSVVSLVFAAGLFMFSAVALSRLLSRYNRP